MKWAVLALVLVACSAERKKCSRMAELAESCWKASGNVADSIEEFCSVSLVQERDSQHGRSLADDAFDAMTECTKATTCDELKACFDRNGCTATFTHQGAEPSFSCWPTHARSPK